MKSMRSFSSFVIPGGMVLVLCCVCSSYATLQEITGDYVPGEIIISFEPGVTEEVVEYLASEFNFSVIRKLRLRNRNKYLIHIGDGQTEEEVINQLIQITDILHAERNAIFRIPERWYCWPKPIIDEGAGDQIDFEDLGELRYITDRPRFNGWPPFEAPVFTFKIHPNDDDTYVVILPLDAVSSSVEGYVANPEPATVLLLGLGALVLRKQRRV